MSGTSSQHKQEPDKQPPDAPFMALATDAPSSLYSLICSLLANSENARDVLQNTNLVIGQTSQQLDRSRPSKL